MTEQRRLKPVGNASAWKPKDFAASSEWMDRLSDGERAELDAALERVRSRGLGAFEFGREDFELPTLGDRLARVVDELDHGRGFVLLRGLDPKAYSMDDLYAVYWGIAVHIGLPISQNGKGEMISQIRDRGNDYKDPNVRGYTTRARLDPHVDTSDMTGLLCVRPAKQGGASTIASSMAMYNHILKHHPQYLDILYRGFHNDLRGEGPTGQLNEVTRHRIPVYSYYQGVLSCGFNGRIIRTAPARMGKELSPLEVEIVDRMEELARDPEFALDMELQPGDLQLINNYTILHSRTEYVDHEEAEMKRLLLRLWVNFREGRPLAENFSERYNSGARGGVIAQPDSAYATGG